MLHRWGTCHQRVAAPEKENKMDRRLIQVGIMYRADVGECESGLQSIAERRCDHI